MTGMVLGSVGTPLAPWHAAQGCAFASISSAACADGIASAMPMPTPKIAETKVANIIFPPLRVCCNASVAGCLSFRQESAMRSKLMLTLAVAAAATVFPPVSSTVRAEGDAALTGIVSSEAEGKMEGVVVTARQAKSIVQVSVTTDAAGRYSFPHGRLAPGE